MAAGLTRWGYKLPEGKGLREGWSRQEPSGCKNRRIERIVEICGKVKSSTCKTGVQASAAHSFSETIFLRTLAWRMKS